VSKADASDSHSLIKTSKADIIRKQSSSASIFRSLTVVTIPHPKVSPVVECDSCLLRLKGFREADERSDPLREKMKRFFRFSN